MQTGPGTPGDFTSAVSAVSTDYLIEDGARGLDNSGPPTLTDIEQILPTCVRLRFLPAHGDSGKDHARFAAGDVSSPPPVPRAPME